METIILNGKEVALALEERIALAIKKYRRKVVLCDIVVGSEPVTQKFVEIKRKAADRVGLSFEVARFDTSVSVDTLIKVIQELNDRADVRGIIVQLPLPMSVEQAKMVLDAIDVSKDVDCLSTNSRELFYHGRSCFSPPTALAVMRLLNGIPSDLNQLNHLVVGQGSLVGLPVAELMRRCSFKFKVADKTTENLQELLKWSDVVVSAVGRPGLISGADIKFGAIVIDAGTSASANGLVGDADSSVAGRASFWAKVPGGVGPVTVAELLSNVIQAISSENPAAL